MVLSLKVIGYYEHCNFGDDQYKSSFANLFKEYIVEDYVLDFYDCDKIYKETFNDTDTIIIGGGDILNSYFLNKINAKFNGRTNTIIALSVGLPYTETLVQNEKLKIIDYIFLRTPQDLMIFKKYFDKDRVFYLPDISYILSENYIFTKNLIQTQQPISQINVISSLSSLSSLSYVSTIYPMYSTFIKDYRKMNCIKIPSEQDTEYIKYTQYIDRINKLKVNHRIMGICLSRHFYNKNYIQEFETVKRGIIQFIKWGLQNDYGIVFIPFNTNRINSNENDIIMANEIINDLSQDKIDNEIVNIDMSISNDQMNETMRLLDICIPMRFHSVLYCIYNMIPFVSVYSTRKIHNLLLETNWEWSYKLPVNEKSVPIDFDSRIVQETIFKLDKQSQFRQNIYQKLLNQKE